MSNESSCDIRWNIKWHIVLDRLVMWHNALNWKVAMVPKRESSVKMALVGGQCLQNDKPLRWLNKTFSGINNLNIESDPKFKFLRQRRGKLSASQCDQIGRFMKYPCQKLSYKSSPNDWWVFGLLQQSQELSKNCSNYILGNYWKHFGHFLIYHLVTLFLFLLLPTSLPIP